MELRGDRVSLRPLAADDLERITAIQSEPGVARWWGDPRPDELEDKVAGRDECTAFAIERDGEVVGLIQYHEEDDPMYRSAGIDLFVGGAHQGRGLGVDAIRTLARHLVHDRGHHRLTIDPAAENTPAIRAYEKAGFRPVGVMRQYERGPDGRWRDGLLMDLLADEI